MAGYGREKLGEGKTWVAVIAADLLNEAGGLNPMSVEVDHGMQSQSEHGGREELCQPYFLRCGGWATARYVAKSV